MKRQTINIGKFEYIAEMYDAVTDYSPVVTKEYVLLRNVSFIENVAYDTDIYFLEKSIFNDIKNNGSLITNHCAFPVHNTNFGSFSQSVNDFSNQLTLDTFKLDSEGGAVFELKKFDENLGEYTSDNVFIPCDKIKIYHPHNKTDLDYIIYLDNTINGIHFHYFCDLRKNCNYDGNKEFTLHNIIYNEYIELFIPNITLLFEEHEIKRENGKIVEDKNIYFNDYYNITKYIPMLESEYNTYQKTQSSNNATWISIKPENTKSLFDDVDKLSLTPLYMLLNPFISLPNNGIDEKVYFKMSNQDTNNYNSLPINITLYPYIVPNINNYYLLNENYYPNSDVFTKEFKFNLRSYVGFAHNQLCIISKFDFYNKYDEITNPEGLTLQKAYSKYNGLHFENGKCKEYQGWFETYEEWKNSLPSYADSSWEAFQYDNDDEIYDNYKEIKCCGYAIEVATDFTFNNIIASSYVEREFIEDFDFPLIHLFNKWNELTNIVIARVTFIDKFLGIKLSAGFIVLNKEWIKYTINDISVPRLFDDFTKKQNSKNDMWNTIDATNTTFNFIDKLNCIVDKKNDNDSISKYGSSGVKIIYKPIFYKAQDLQNISLLSGMKQKVGINLSEYMTKVSIFKLIIGDVEYAEYGRNDIYVIFDVDANIIEGTSGVYHIVDSSETYISSGIWNKK